VEGIGGSLYVGPAKAGAKAAFIARVLRGAAPRCEVLRESSADLFSAGLFSADLFDDGGFEYFAVGASDEHLVVTEADGDGGSGTELAGTVAVG